MGTIMQKRLPAATIVETMVALVIIMAVFGIATTVFVQVSLHSFSVKRLQATDMLNAYALTTVEQQSFIDEEIVKDGFTLKRTIAYYNDQQQLAAITFTVQDANNELLAKQKRIYRIK